MCRNTCACIKGLTAGIMVGGAVFFVTKTMCSQRKPCLKTTAGKAIKALGSILETL